jgi:hypothetical protein
MSEELLLTVSVPEWGEAAYGFGPYASYGGAARGDFPIVTVGHRKRVPVRLALRKLIGDDPAEIEKVTARLREIVGKKKRAAA